MSKAVSLKDLVDEMEVQFDEMRSFLHVKTGELVGVSQSDLRLAEEDEPYEHLPEWQQEQIKLAIDIIENDEDYIELPTQFDVNEYEMLESFSYSQVNEKQRITLLQAISGKGAFRRFKDTVIQLGIADQWYSFRNECYKQIAIEWCKDHDVEYVE